MRRSARLAYCVLFTLAMILAWVLRDFAKPLIDKIPCKASLTLWPDASRTAVSGNPVECSSLLCGSCLFLSSLMTSRSQTESDGMLRYY